MSEDEKKTPDTSELSDEIDDSQLEPLRIAFGAEISPDEITYRPMPGMPSRREGEAPPVPWRIVLIGGTSLDKIIGLDIYDDTVLGRGPVGLESHGVDLGPLGADDEGVSRRHALLRPTPTNLYVIDLNSTNGTLHNSVPVGPGIARAIEDGDTLLLGRLGLAVRVISRPPRQKPASPVIRLDQSDVLDAEDRHPMDD